MFLLIYVTVNIKTVSHSCMHSSTSARYSIARGQESLAWLTEESG